MIVETREEFERDRAGETGAVLAEASTAARPCATPGCAALAASPRLHCAVHGKYLRRAAGSAPIYCASCDALIAVGAAFTRHLGRALCTKAPCEASDPARWFSVDRTPFAKVHP